MIVPHPGTMEPCHQLELLHQRQLVLLLLMLPFTEALPSSVTSNWLDLLDLMARDQPVVALCSAFVQLRYHHLICHRLHRASIDPTHPSEPERFPWCLDLTLSG